MISEFQKKNCNQVNIYQSKETLSLYLHKKKVTA